MVTINRIETADISNNKYYNMAESPRVLKVNRLKKYQLNLMYII